MMRARFIIVEETTGEVLNAYVVECAANWPPPFVGTVAMVDTLCKYQIGDLCPTPLSLGLAKSKANAKDKTSGD